jgi:formylglycine-generating enzyme required for sulfatase activity
VRPCPSPHTIDNSNFAYWVVVRFEGAATLNQLTHFQAVRLYYKLPVIPSRFLTWFQATAAARNSGKRLPANAEWQAAALGTPDSGVCIQAGGIAAATGTAGCVSHVGAFDMIGNVWEWVADWVPRSTTCVNGAWQASFGLIDSQCLAGAATDGLPGALLRGGDFNSVGEAGVYAITGLNAPTLAQGNVGFRAAR